MTSKEIQIMTTQNSSTDTQPAKRYFLNGKEVNLQLNGSDNPTCPNCKRYNAMLYDGPRNDSEDDFALKCRDCGTEVIAVHTVFQLQPLALPWVREAGGSMSIIDAQGRHIAEIASSYWNGRTVAHWTDEEIASHAKVLTRAAVNVYPKLVEALRETRRTLETLLTCDNCAACEYCNGHKLIGAEITAIDAVLAGAEVG
jgi:hypothetical protein